MMDGDTCPNCGIGEMELREDNIIGDRYVCTVCEHAVIK